MNNTLKTMMNRKSVRKFSDKAISPEDIKTIGSCWLGTWPVIERVKNQAALFGLPEHIVPHSVIAFGYPADDVPPGPRPGRPEWDADRVHFETW